MCYSQTPYHAPCGHYSTSLFSTPSASRCIRAETSKSLSRGCPQTTSLGTITVATLCTRCERARAAQIFAQTLTTAPSSGSPSSSSSLSSSLSSSWSMTGSAETVTFDEGGMSGTESRSQGSSVGSKSGLFPVSGGWSFYDGKLTHSNSLHLAFEPVPVRAEAAPAAGKSMYAVPPAKKGKGDVLRSFME